MPNAINFTFNAQENRYEGKISEVCQNSPFIPVQVGIIHRGQAVIFSQVERVRDEGDSHLLYVDYLDGYSGLALRVFNDYGA